MATEPLPTAAENPNGLHQRYIVTKALGGPVDEHSFYFVLRLDSHGDDPAHIRACRAAAKAYIDCVHTQRDAAKHLLQMADELWKRLYEMQREPFSVPKPCDHCGGYGQVNATGVNWQPCPKCNGKKYVAT